MTTSHTSPHLARLARRPTAAILLLGSLALAAGPSAALPINGLFNTGVDDAGTVLPLHALDPHYTLSGVATVARIVPTDPVWVQAPAGSAWIGPNPNDHMAPDPEGLYAYTLTFDLAGVDLTDLHLGGWWATDNMGQLWLNGHYTGYDKNAWGFVRLDYFFVDSGLNAGLNTIEFRVANIPPPEGDGTNPSGLLVAGLALTTHAPTPTVPDAGATLPLLGAAGLGLLLLRSGRYGAASQRRQT